ncbi:hypothetical protein FGIG_04511 [Fasciola gigantica]|uniref:Uncharacterized protein n=1 Tax=Fasciola gigantica TaxID=46835 RepID=A0A504YWB5_FASGI|nr:hypothetical protein FGIG_04511 [Fasciola gigantica]
MPKPESDPSGTNYFDTKTETLYVVIKGLSVVEIRYQPLIIISFGIPAMTEADFYGSNVVDNMAKFLGIPSSRIRIAKIVSESSGGSRRRRAAATLNVQLEISEPPSATAQPINTSSPAAQSTVQTQPTLLETVSAKLVNSVQTNSLSSALNTTISGVQLVEPPPQPGSERWQVLASSTGGVSSTPQVIQIPYSAEISVNATVVEGEPFTILLSTNDAGKTHVSKLGTETDPWKYSLFGSQTVTGLASVNNASFSSTNNGYTILEKTYVNSTGTHQLSVTIADPSSTTVLNKSITFTVSARKFDLKASLIGQEEQTNGTSGNTTILLQFRVQMFDQSTGRNSESLDWRGFTWKLVAGLCSDTGSPSFVGSTVSSLLADYHWNTSVPKTNDKYTFCFNLNAYQSNESDTVLSEYTPSPYSLDYQTSSGTTQANYVKLVRLTFPGTLASISAVIDKFKEAVKTKVLALCPSVTISDITLSEGSILTDVTMNSNSESSLTTASQTVQDSVNAGTMTVVVDGVHFTATNTVTTTNPNPTRNRGTHIHWAFGLNILNLVRWVLI